VDDSAGLKQKIAELEKRVSKQEKDLADFAGQFAQPKDFSADMQRLEDQQERVSQVLKTQVEPINSRLEEFRDWAQEAQKEREEITNKLKVIEQSVSEAVKGTAADRSEVSKLSKEVAANKKRIAAMSKGTEDFSKGLADLRKEVLDNNAKLVAAVKKTLPKVRDAAVDKLKEQITPLEQRLTSIKTAMEADRKALEALKTQAPQASAAADAGTKEFKALQRRINELEDALTSQKAFLLEMGTKVHELETRLR